MDGVSVGAHTFVLINQEAAGELKLVVLRILIFFFSNKIP